MFWRATPHVHLEKAYRRQQGKLKKKKKTDLGEEHTINHTNFSQGTLQGLHWLLQSRMLVKDVG